MKKSILLSLALICSLGCVAQKNRMGDYLESTSYNDDKRGAERWLQYVPKDDAFVCVNGKNRFTRALYGGYTQYRLETSDRPAFALFLNSRNCRNIQVFATYKGTELSLDATDFCEARYTKGMRTYIVRDHRWGNAEMLIDATCLYDADAALLRFTTKGFDSDVTLKAVMKNIAVTRLSRNGDLGADKPGCFEANGDALDTKQWSMRGNGESFARTDSLEFTANVNGKAAFEKNLKLLNEVANRIHFDTPDPYINAIDEALMFAAEGAWDGETWLHGAIGWRMPLNGWRAGYLSDVLGWDDRAKKHFNAYAASQVTDVEPIIPHPSQDAAMNMARAEKKWGTQMYSTGYICRNPNRNDQMHHYDMNLNYIDELLWHFQYDADIEYMKQMWQVLERHLAWEKRNFDPDGDHLYDSYCCIWASDALYYSGGAGTHSTAYNYRGNLLAAKIAKMIGKDGSKYEAEAAAILKAMNERLWVKDGQHWAEYQDLMGLQRVHEDAALWSIYTPVDCGVGTPEQMYQTTRYVDRNIPHIDVRFSVPEQYKNYWHPTAADQHLQVISTSDWLPYNWSINNVASAEIMNMVLAYFKAGQSDKAYRILKGNVMDQMYVGDSPGNLGQVSFYDAARGECYRDFSDNTGISARAFIQGLFGIVPQALDGICYIQPGFPQEWNHASITTPYLSYSFHRENGKDIYEIRQNFKQPLRIIFRQSLGNGKWRIVEGNSEQSQQIVVESRVNKIDNENDNDNGHSDGIASRFSLHASLSAPTEGKVKRPMVNLHAHFNAEVDDIYKQKYLSPRPQVTTLQIPTQGIGEWCHPQYTAEINDSVLRTLIVNDTYNVAGVDFLIPKEGKNIIYTSRWDNYPTRYSVPLKGKANFAYLLMAGSTNPMQSHIENAHVVVTYTDATSDTLHLIPPYNWCPIEQDYFVDGMAFKTLEPRPYRLCLGTGDVSRNLGKLYHIKEVYGRELPGGAAQMLKMPLNAKKKLKSLTLESLSNDVVVGLMAITLER